MYWIPVFIIPYTSSSSSEEDSSEEKNDVHIVPGNLVPMKKPTFPIRKQFIPPWVNIKRVFDIPLKKL